MREGSEMLTKYVRDTVCSVGLIPRRLPFVSSNTAIRTFRHAVSLDEHRAKFKANLYNRPTNDETKLGVQPGEMPKPTASSSVAAFGVERFKEFVRKAERSKSSAEEEEEQDDSREVQYDPCSDEKQETDVLEVWFAGCHCGMHTFAYCTRLAGSLT